MTPSLSISSTMVVDAVAITRDADGEVLELHKLKQCSDPVDCEVR